MLIRFGFENLYSFPDYTEVPLTAARISDVPSHTFRLPGTEESLLPAIAIYGANAAGKSNVIGAFAFLRNEVVGSFVNRKPTAPVPRSAFRLGAHASAESRVDCDIVVDGARYHYGFACDDEKFTEEWLYSWPRGVQRLLFYRGEGAEDGWKFGPSLRGRKKLIASATRPNSLFLSTAAQQNHETLTPLYAAFESGMYYRPAGLADRGGVFLDDDPILREENKEKVVQLLKASDLGIQDFRVDRTEENYRRLIDKMKEDGASEDRIKEVEKAISDIGPLRTVRLGHAKADGTADYFDYRNESRGTQMLLDRLGPLLQVLSHGGLYVVDEFDSGMHPHLAAALLGLFTNAGVNRKGAQILFSTHTSELLEGLRRDEIALVEKSTVGSSTLTLLTEYRTKKRDDIRRGYMAGRFGGVPTLDDLARIFQTEPAA